MAEVLGGIIFFGGTALFVWALFSGLRRLSSALSRRRQSKPVSAAPSAAGEPAADFGAEAREARGDAVQLRRELGEFPVREELENSEPFGEAVARLLAWRPTLDELVRLARDGDRWVSRIALAALAGRNDLPLDWPSYAVRRLRQAPYDQAWLFLRSLEDVPDPVVGPVLSQLEHVYGRDVAELIAVRAASGREMVDAETFRRHVPLRHAPLVESMLEENEEMIPGVREAFESWRTATVDLDFVKQFARVWVRPLDSPPALLVGGRGELVETIHQAITADPPEPLLLVGEHGVGKTALIRAALDQLPASWLIFEATASSVNAGAMYIGELEGRVQQIVETLRGQRAVWVLPALEEALYAGRYTQSPTGLLDHLLPHLAAGDLRIVAEISPTALETVLAQRPQVATVFSAVRVRPLGEHESIAVAAHALQHDPFHATATDQVLAESFDLAQQFLPGAASPGNLVRVIESTAEAVAERGADEIETADVLATLGKISGLPLALLDPEAPLDLDEVRVFFEERVLGQPEAVDCLVERVALIKSGLTDPTRPLGVFLFVGPTGTGKTEMAKAFAEFLFGSASRLVRLDMTEYQTPDSLERLLSDTNVEPQGAPLIASVRKDPFSVVLLDEFEKAATPIWDVFLQVFDDGRLTDRHGRNVDLRRCVIILTSNVGSSITTGPRLGFDDTPETFRPETIKRAVQRSFRPEFLNRLDRVVVFRPFERSQMRALLEKELADATHRRGFRGRPWAVEYDDSAIEFLVDQGFSPDLGARPLKRAIERHVLAPLAKAIVHKAVPAGDQFLFLTAPKGRIEVRFVDPDADDSAAAVEEARPTDRDLDVRSLSLAPRSDPAATAFLLDELQRIGTSIRGDAVAGRKHDALDAVSRPGFWESESRFPVLAEAEYLDRLDEAFRTAERLGHRLEQRSRNGRGSRELAGLLATRLYVLESALTGLAERAPFDVFLRLRPIGDVDKSEETTFAQALAGMYMEWAERRGMGIERVKGGNTAEQIFSVRGLGAATILAPEAGLHILELAAETEAGERSDRVVVAVEIAPWAPGPDAASTPDRAQKAFAGVSAPTQVVRRYRPGPAPLVRDAVRGYRTGRFDRVLAGDFDIF
jgi:ATP-dependent Clp protease ATP-binding subunit ClpC